MEDHSPLRVQQQQHDQLQDGPPVVAIGDVCLTGYYNNPVTPPLTRIERALLGLECIIRNKPQWSTDIRNPAVVASWREEIRAEATPIPTTPFDEKVWLERLRTYENPTRASFFKAQGFKANNIVAAYVRKHLECEYGETLAPGDQILLQQHINRMRNERTIAVQLDEEHWFGNDIVLETAAELLRVFWSDQLFDFAIADSIKELEECRLFRTPPEVLPGGVRMTFQADNYIAPIELAALKELAAVLKDEPDSKRDWRAGHQVLDILDPSLYCYTSGVSRRLPASNFSPSPAKWLETIGSGEPSTEQFRDIFGRTKCKEYVETTAFNFSAYGRCDLHTWLPTECHVDDSGTVGLMSYVNNLHPSHVEGYKVLTDIFAKFLPLFERVASDLVAKEERFATIFRPGRFLDYKAFGAVEGGPFEPNPPIPPLEKPLPARQVITTLNGSSPQAFSRLIDINLTPEHPMCAGGKWRSDATDNEGLSPEFRLWCLIGDGQPSTARATKELFGAIYHGDCLQHYGTVDAIEGRCKAFSNFHQYRARPFGLKDPSKPGHLKVLYTYLVDPTAPRVSTADAPPQQIDWFIAELLRPPAALLGRLPRKIWTQILEALGYENVKQAREKRARIKKSRAQQDSTWYGAKFESPHAEPLDMYW
ncbi:hypothetical protein BDZ88DRAFT_468502 [Geranomyces variabilis]|nr:hypothetical protein BDZ88DRAFT_468502 [Geranomyces variabilis]KAJ3140034.1 hypothetical protein HDU90_008938 [Geranomyces variabilis]